MLLFFVCQAEYYVFAGTVDYALPLSEGAVMNRDFRYFKDKYGEAGARDIFEKICTQIYIEAFGEEAHAIKADPGDEGIDILVGDFSSPIDVYQCKYFVDGICDSQKDQIRKSFTRSVNSSAFKLKSWTLCLPSELNIKEFRWWSEWKNQMIGIHHIDINLHEGSYLIARLKEQKAYDRVFDNDIRMALDEIQEYLSFEKRKRLDEIVAMVGASDVAQFDGMIFVRKLENARIEEIDGCKRDFFNAELAEQAVKSQGDDDSILIMEKLKTKVYSVWETQYRRYKHDTDGNDLLTRAYERIEEMDSTSLSVPLSQYGMLAKKGILHQWAEDCSVGWLTDYVTKLEDYLKDVGSGL